MQFWLVLYPRWERFVHTGCVPVGDIVDVNDGSFTTTNAATDVEAKRKAIKVNCVIIFLNIYFVWIRKLCGKGCMRWRSTVRSIFALGVYLVNSGSQRISLGEYCKLCRWNICTFKSLGAVRKKWWHRSTTNNAKHHAHAYPLTKTNWPELEHVRGYVCLVESGGTSTGTSNNVIESSFGHSLFESHNP